MPPLVLLATTVLTSIGVPTAIASFLANMAVSIGIGLIQKALSPKPKTGWRGDTQQISFDPNDPRRFLFGRSATAGALVTFCSWGTNNEYTKILIRVADHKCVGLVRVWISGVLVTIGAGGAVSQYYADGHDNLWINFVNGDWNQSADADLVANSGGHWTSSDVGRGISYVTIKARYNEKAFPNGLSTLYQCVFEIDGMPLYDRRFDTSVGGSGSQRWNDQSAWALSDNPVVIGENVLRGIRVEDTTGAIGSRTMDQFFGLTLADADLPFSDNIAGMNDCDGTVSLKAGGSEKRYRCAGLISCDTDIETALEDICATMAGNMVSGVGRWIFKAGVARTPVRTFTDADFRLDGPSKYVDAIPLADIVNGVAGRFADPAALYQPTDAPPRTSLTDETDDSGRKMDTIDLAYVTSQTQAQRIMEIHRRRGRRMSSGTKTVAPENLDLEALDWIAWQSDRYGWTRYFELAQMTPKTGDDDMLQVVLDFAEIDSGVYAWTPATDELSRTTPAFLPSAGTSVVNITSLAVVSDVIVKASGEVAPVLKISIDAPTDPSVNGVRFYYRVNGTPAGADQVLHQDFTVNPAAVSGTLVFNIAAGLIGGFQYDVQATALRTPAADEHLTSWVTTPTITAPTQNQWFNSSTDPALSTTVYDGAHWANPNGTVYIRFAGSWVLTATRGVRDGDTLFTSTTPGSWSYTVQPGDLPFVTVTVKGAGGGTSDVLGSFTGPHFGGEGGTSVKHFAVSAGDVISGTVGTKGSNTTTNTNATAGTATTANRTSPSVAMNANGGAGGTTSANGAGGTASGGDTNTTGATGSGGGVNGSVSIVAHST